MSVSKSDIKIFLTSAVPSIAQANYSQSIGGYISTSLLYPISSLASTVGMYDTSITIPVMDAAGFAAAGVNYLSIDREIIKINGNITSGTISNIQRAYNNVISSHVSGEVVMGVKDDLVFNNEFNPDHKQYRCFAVKNCHVSDTAYKIYAYIYQKKYPTSTIKISLEIPKNDYWSSSTLDWDIDSLTDAGLASSFSDDDHFSGAVISINDGITTQNRLVSTYEGSTGKIYFDEPLPEDTGLTINYIIYPGPSQRIKTGTVKPVIAERCGEFYESYISNSYYLNSSGLRADADLKANDLFYIWVERSVEKDSEGQTGNDFILVIYFSQEP